MANNRGYCPSEPVTTLGRVLSVFHRVLRAQGPFSWAREQSKAEGEPLAVFPSLHTALAELVVPPAVLTTLSSCTAQEATASSKLRPLKLTAVMTPSHCPVCKSQHETVSLLIRDCFVSIWHWPSQSDTNYLCQLPSESWRYMKSQPETIHHSLQWDLGPVTLMGY